MNWGIKITIVYIGFVLLIVSMVFISAGNKSELVAKDYYAQELKYQERIDAINNEKQLKSTITVELLEDEILLHYPATGTTGNLKGEVVFFRPSDASKDKKITLSPGSDGKQHISKKLLSKGVYKLCISWSSNQISFYKEEIITI